MAKAYYQTTKVVKVTAPDKVVIKSASSVAGAKGDPGTSILTGPGQPSNLVGRVGDLWVDTNTKIVYGPKANSGWPSASLFEGFNHDLLGVVISVSTNQVQQFTNNGVLYGEWHIQHNLGYNPNATCIDSKGRVIEGEISYPDKITIVLRFIGVTSGKVYLS